MAAWITWDDLVGVTASIAALIAILAPAPASAIDPERKLTDHQLDHWLPEHGLPQASVQTIAQSADGYLWLGTQEGLARFDGVRFEVFDSRTTEALDSNRITSAVAHGGALWFTPSGEGVARHEDGEIVTFSMAGGTGTDQARGLVSGGDDGLWWLTDCCLVNRRGDEITRFDYRRDLGDDEATALIRAGDGSLWLGTRGGTVARWNGATLDVILVADQLDAGAIQALLPATDGTLWIGTRLGGLAAFRDGQLQWFPGPTYITALLQDRHHEVWIGTFDRGLCQQREDHFECLDTSEGMPDDTVIALHEDHEGSLWVGTMGAGLVRLRDATFTSVTTVDGLPSNGVWSVARGADGVWVNSEQGMAQVTSSGVQTVPLPDHRNGMSVFEDRQGCTWIGSEKAGLARLCDGRWTTFDPPEGGPSEPIYAMAQDSAGAVWFGTGAGLFRFTGDGFRRFGTEDGLPGEHVRALQVDSEGTLWVGLYGDGLATFDGEGFIRFEPDTALSRAQLAVCDIQRGADQTLWIGTTGGLLRIRGGRTAAFTAEHGLFDDTVYSVIEDDAGHLWMSCNRGVSRVDRRQLDAVARGDGERVEPQVFDVGDGMPATECSGGAEASGVRTSDGRLWFPTIGGVAVVDPSEILSNDVPPPVHIEQVLVENSPVEAHGPLELRAGTRHLQVQFTALSFIAPDQIRFRYMLEGYDDTWIEAGTQRIAHYTGLPPGSFTFRVTACNSDGVWNRQGAALSLRKRPYFHQTPLFYGLCGLLLLGVFTGVYTWRLRRLKRRQQEIEELVERRSRQLVEAEDLLAEARHLPIRFGPYVLVAILGEGGMARVYRAVREGPMGFRKELAIKRIRTDLTRDDDDLVRSMINEARLGGQLQHPNVVDTYEFGSVGNQYYIAMEYVDGWTLRALIDGARLRGVRLPPGAVIDLALQICAGLSYAHQRRSPEGKPLNLVHRDLKPANVILSVAGVAKIMDFGIARSETAAFHTTRSHVVKGTPRFMSPEQLQAPQTIDSRSDLFALGGLLFRALPGEDLLSGPSVESLMWQIVSGAFSERLTILDDVIPAARPVLERCLAADREQRFIDAEALAVDLRALRREVGDPRGCEDLVALVRAFAVGDHDRLAVLRARLMDHEAAQGAWLVFVDALASIDEGDPDPYRRPVVPGRAVAPSAAEFVESPASDQAATVMWRSGDPDSIADD
jgi:ligand-binding sensor domain-containing protein